jgi:hypothetical protein
MLACVIAASLPRELSAKLFRAAAVAGALCCGAMACGRTAPSPVLSATRPAPSPDAPSPDAPSPDAPSPETIALTVDAGPGSESPLPDRIAVPSAAADAASEKQVAPEDLRCRKPLAELCSYPCENFATALANALPSDRLRVSECANGFHVERGAFGVGHEQRSYDRDGRLTGVLRITEQSRAVCGKETDGVWIWGQSTLTQCHVVQSLAPEFDRLAAARSVGALALDAKAKCGALTTADNVHLFLTFSPLGTVREVSVDAPHGGTKVGKCLEAVMARARVPAFGPSPIKIGKTIQFR